MQIKPYSMRLSRITDFVILRNFVMRFPNSKLQNYAILQNITGVCNIKNAPARTSILTGATRSNLLQIFAGTMTGIGHTVIGDLNVKPLHTADHGIETVVLDFGPLRNCSQDRTPFSRVHTGTVPDIQAVRELPQQGFCGISLLITKTSHTEKAC